MKTISKIFAIVVVLGLVFGFAPTAGVRAATNVIVVTPATPDWIFYNDNGTTGDWTATFEVGPGTPPLGIGSATIELNSASAGIILTTQKYQGVRLADITALRYSTYTNQSPQAMAFQINYDPDVTTVEGSTWYGRLNYEPYNSGTVTNDTWQTWDMLTTGAKWWASGNANSTVDEACPQSAPCTLTALLAAFPNIGIRNDALSGIGFKAGSNWNGFAGNVDNFVITTAGNTDIYDFEPLTVAYVDDSWSAVTIGDDPDGAGPAQKFGYDSFAVIQEGIDAVIPGGTVYVAAGTYNEQVNINKRVSIIGAGKDGAAPTIITSTAYPTVLLGATGTNGSPVLLQGLQIQGSGGIRTTITPIDYFTMDNVWLLETGTGGEGFRLVTGHQMTHLTITNSIIDGYTDGVIIEKTPGTGNAGTKLQYVTVTDTIFRNNHRKGLYIETLSDAIFTNVQLIDNGYYNPGTTLAEYNSAGFDINLKDGAYQNLKFNNMTATGNGLYAKDGAALMIKARDDGATYGLYPATLDNVLITGGSFTGNERGIRIGEPNKNNAGPTDVVITRASLYDNVKTYTGTDGSAYGDVINYSLAPVDATPNYWGTAIKSMIEPKISGDVTFTPYYVDAAMKILSEPLPNEVWVDDDYTYSPESCGTHICGYDAFETIPEGIDGVAAGGTVNVAAGTYAEINILINKSLTLLGDPGDAAAGPGVNAPLIDGGGAYGDAFKLANGVTNVTIKGFEVADYATSGFDGVGNAISAWVGSTSNITIQDNYFHDLEYNGVLVGNDYNADPAKWGDHTNWLIKANILEDFGFIGFELTNTSSSIVEDNIIHMATPYIGAFFSSARRSESDLIVRNNYIDGTPSAAYPIIYIYAYDMDMANPNLDNVLIEGNTIAAAPATPYQVYIRNIGTGTVTNVTIEDNALLSLKNLTSVPIDASPNYWGTAIKSMIEPKISGDVTFTPYYVDAAMKILSEPLPNEVWVDDDYTYSPESCGTHICGYDGFITIQEGINGVAAGGTVNVAAGTYSDSLGGWRDLEITKSLSLVGAGKEQTIVEFTNLQHGLEIRPDATGAVTVQGITFTKQAGNANSAGWPIFVGETGGTFSSLVFRDLDVGYASARNIHLNAAATYNNLVVEDCDVHHSNVWGMSIAGPANGVTITGSNFTDNGFSDPVHGNGLDFENPNIQNVLVTTSTFNDNAGKGININGLKHAVFDGITANHNGNFNGSVADYEMGFNLWDHTGGSQDIVVKNSTFAYNERAGLSLGNEIAGLDDIEITANTIIGNGHHAMLYWFYSPYGDISVHHNRIIHNGNAESLIGRLTAPLDLPDNWWGCNAGFGQTGCSGGQWSETGSFTTSSWLVMNVTDLPATIDPYTTTAFDADLRYNNLGADTSAAGYLPATTSVGFTPIDYVDPDSDLLTNGVAGTTFTAPVSGGISTNVCAVLDNQTVCETSSTPTATDFYVDDDWVGLAAGTRVTPTWPAGAPVAMIGFDAFAAIQPAIDAAWQGANIYVGAGTYVEDPVIDKALTLLGPNAYINPNTGTRVPEAIILPAYSAPDPSVCEVMTYIETSGVTIKGFTFDGDNPALTSGIMIGTADVDACEIIASYEGVGSIVIENNILKHATYTGMDFYNYYNNAATAGNYITNNLLQNIGETTYNWGIGILLYNNFYADVTGNVLDNVRTGIQTGNYYRANTGTTGSISNNTINVWRLGIFHNLWYGSASPITVSDNTINAIAHTGATKWNGMLISSFGGAANAVVANNNINIPDAITFAAPGYAAGYNIWNDNTTLPLVISGGTVTGGDYGVFVNNYEGYSSDAGNTAVTIDKMTILGSNIAGVYVKDSPSNTNGATVYANITANNIDTDGTGILIEGTDATADAYHNDVVNNPTASISNLNTAFSMDADLNYWGSGFGPQSPVNGDVDVIQWCTTAWNEVAGTGCTPLAPVGGVITIGPGLVNISGGINAYVPGITYLVLNGTTIQNTGEACFNVFADNTTIMAESKLGAKCVPAAGKNGINVAAGLQDINIINLEIDGSEGGANGIYFSGVVDYLTILDNWIHDLAGNGVEFRAKPTGIISIQGNLFQNNGGNGIESYGSTIPAEFNSWGHLDGPATGDGVSLGVDATPWTHVDLYLYSTSPVSIGGEVTYTVYGNLANVMGAGFTLAYPTDKLQLVAGSLTNLSGFVEVSAGAGVFDTTTAGEIRFNGKVPASTAISGSNLPIYSVKFNVLGDGGVLDLVETGAEFTMAPVTADPTYNPSYSTNIYPLAFLDALVTTGNYTVQGTFTMEYRYLNVRAGIPGALTGSTYGYYTATSVNPIPNNLKFLNVAGGATNTYTFTTLQPRYLNITADLGKTFTVTGNYTFASPLTLIAGNAIWTDNEIDVLDAGLIGGKYGAVENTDADVNFDGKVSLADLSIVGINYGKTSAGNYTWTP